MRTIQVKTESAKYPVVVGSGLLSTLWRRLPKRNSIFVLTSPEIWALWSKYFLASFPKGNQPAVLFLPAGEQYKRLTYIEQLASQLASHHADRSSLLVAFGGGIIGDIGGFLAAIYMRGIDYIQIPSTLLAQVDSSVGGKTGANLASGKNLIGSFHHPLSVFADIDLLRTLPDRELRAGLFESLKAGVIRDARLFRFMERNAETILKRGNKALEYVISASIRMKADVVGIDEKESGLRMILNFGHTVGHAIEAAMHYRKLLHGEAVAWGMLAALQLGRMRGTISTTNANRVERTILDYGPLPHFKTTAQRLLDAASRDKKNRAGVRRFVLPQEIGNASVIENVTDTELIAAIDWMLSKVKES
ncbi:3-dehydroquinate synthase [Alloacidobacterium dinghuense]|uniref:3-dehydroquinate synthase n=1 Tax=Alloacidobacterium dinghuense TaxID=2763107 RepID=A0A7G8BHV6_9BACT|nr:3-dehydroquinate synthase [Alloacidobacterium dinghuense]QNI32126.1 3-dehydroquinate synthase [Alloacidobacterium dinghuense]